MFCGLSTERMFKTQSCKVSYCIVKNFPQMSFRFKTEWISILHLHMSENNFHFSQDCLITRTAFFIYQDRSLNSRF